MLDVTEIQPVRIHIQSLQFLHHPIFFVQSDDLFQEVLFLMQIKSENGLSVLFVFNSMVGEKIKALEFSNDTHLLF